MDGIMSGLDHALVDRSLSKTKALCSTVLWIYQLFNFAVKFSTCTNCIIDYQIHEKALIFELNT